MLNLNSVMIGTDNVAAMAEYYEKILGKKADMVEEGWYGWVLENGFLSIGTHSEVKGKAVQPQRVIFNMQTPEVVAEFERMKQAGALVVKEPYDAGGGMMIATLTDPDGNYFQLVSPWK